MDWWPWFETAVAVISFGAAVISGLMALRQSRESPSRIRLTSPGSSTIFFSLDKALGSPKTIEAKIQRIQALSSELDSLNTGLRAAFDEQIAATEAAKVKADEARQDAASAKQIADLTQHQIEATRALLANEMKHELEVQATANRKSEHKFQIWVAVASFFGGVVVTILVPLIIQGLTATVH